jgi:hypothetical protein
VLIVGAVSRDATDAYGMSASFTGVDQASPIDAHAGFTQSQGNTAGRNITTIADGAWLVDAQYNGADMSVTPTSGQTVLTNVAVASGRTNDRVLMTTKGPISPAGNTNVSYSFSDSSQAALSILSLKPAGGSSSSSGLQLQTEKAGRFAGSGRVGR